MVVNSRFLFGPEHVSETIITHFALFGKDENL